MIFINQIIKFTDTIKTGCKYKISDLVYLNDIAIINEQIDYFKIE